MRQPEKQALRTSFPRLKKSSFGVRLHGCGLRIKVTCRGTQRVSSTAVRTLDEDFSIAAIAFSGGHEWAFFSWKMKRPVSRRAGGSQACRRVARRRAKTNHGKFLGGKWLGRGKLSCGSFVVTAIGLLAPCARVAFTPRHYYVAAVLKAQALSKTGQPLLRAGLVLGCPGFPLRLQ